MTSTYPSDHAARAILLIEETASMARSYGAELERAGLEVITVPTVQEARPYLDGAAQPGLVLIDMKTPDPAGLVAIDNLRGGARAVPVVVMTDHGSINMAVEAMRRGASDFLVRPFGGERLVAAVRGAMQHRPPGAGQSVDHDIAGLPAGGADEPAPVTPLSPRRPTPVHGDNTARPMPLDFGGFIGLSPVMQDLYEKIENVARSHAPVFITGESGTGKEVCAEAIHRHSRRAGRPFVPINCAAIPRDLIESELFGHVKGAFTGAIADREGAARLADGGTLFLDEIAEMHPDMQTKLLRFLQNQTFMKVGGSRQEQSDVRIICATNRDPLAETRVGRFREDLYYRLHVLPLHMPPLRDRGDDVIDIAEVLIRRYNEEEGKSFRGLSDEAAATLRAYGWPGNIRQLQNIIRNIIVMHDGELIQQRMLPPALQKQPTGRPAAVAGPGAAASPGAPDAGAPVRPLAVVEREAIEHAIAVCGGNIPRAAVMLGISPSTIYRKKLGWDEAEGNGGSAAH